MKAVFFEKLGGLEVLKYGDFPTPKPQNIEALIRIKACGLNHLDIRDLDDLLSKKPFSIT